MSVNLKQCPHSPSHRVYGGYPEYVCPTCATEWVVVRKKENVYVLYTHFNSSGEIARRWKVPLDKGIVKKRSLVAS